jgi:hypothetical protein
VAVLKCALAGFVGSAAAAATYVIGSLLFVLLPIVRRHGETVGVDLRLVLVRPVFWVIVALAFALGCYWEFRRLLR